MIVGSYFEGDDVEVALKQHGVYDTALGIVVSTCNFYTNRARSLLNSSDLPNWGKIDRYDHRTLSRDREKPVLAPSHLGRSAPDNASYECVKHARPPCNQVPCRTMIERSGRDGLSRLE